MLTSGSRSVTGFFTPSATMAQQLETAAQIAGEKIWRMPLVEQYCLKLFQTFRFRFGAPGSKHLVLGTYQELSVVFLNCT